VIYSMWLASDVWDSPVLIQIVLGVTSIIVLWLQGRHIKKSNSDDNQVTQQIIKEDNAMVKHAVNGGLNEQKEIVARLTAQLTNAGMIPDDGKNENL
jgi:hypothetical protein